MLNKFNFTKFARLIIINIPYVEKEEEESLWIERLGFLWSLTFKRSTRIRGGSDLIKTFLFCFFFNHFN